jgi:hypothetical protein
MTPPSETGQRRIPGLENEEDRLRDAKAQGFREALAALDDRARPDLIVKGAANRTINGLRQLVRPVLQRLSDIETQREEVNAQLEVVLEEQRREDARRKRVELGKNPDSMINPIVEALTRTPHSRHLDTAIASMLATRLGAMANDEAFRKAFPSLLEDGRKSLKTRQGASGDRASIRLEKERMRLCFFEDKSLALFYTPRSGTDEDVSHAFALSELRETNGYLADQRLLVLSVNSDGAFLWGALMTNDTDGKIVGFPKRDRLDPLKERVYALLSEGELKLPAVSNK